MNARMEWDATQVKAGVSPEEWQTRVDLAACYRAVAMMGWDDLVFTHITAKIPWRRPQFSDQSLRFDVRGNHRVFTRKD